MPKLKSAIDACHSITEASARFGLGYLPLIRRYFHLYRRRRFSPFEIQFNDLLNPRISDEALQCHMSKEEMLAFDDKHALDAYWCATSDKAIFYSLCMAAGIPIPRLLAVFDRPEGWGPDGQVLRARSDWCAFLQSLPQDFIVKPAFGLLGKGVNAFHRDATEFLDYQGRRRTDDELYEFLCSERDLNLFTSGYSHHSLNLPHGSHKTIIQERLYAHPEIVDLTGSRTLCTCRLFTRTDRAGNFHLLGTAFRVVGGNALVDNFDQGAGGNLWCSVDADTGRIREAFVRPPEADRVELISRHPLTGRAVVGFPIPHWSRAVEMARKLAGIFRPQSVITWDIGVTSDGPVAVEGNLGGYLLPTRLSRPVRTLLTDA